MSCLRSRKHVEKKDKEYPWYWFKKLGWKVLFTISILEDNSQHVSHQQLVVANNPQRLHLRVHVTTLFHTDGWKEQCKVKWRRKTGLNSELWSVECCLTWCQKARCLDLEENAGRIEPQRSRSALNRSSWLLWSTLPPLSCFGRSLCSPAWWARSQLLVYSGLPPGVQERYKGLSKCQKSCQH